MAPVIKVLLPVALAAALLATSCAGDPGARAIPTPTPTPPVACAAGDAALVESALGWAFCLPGTWRYRERTQSTQAPVGTDTTFDVTDFATGPTHGLFGFIIVSTDPRVPGQSLSEWVAQNVQPGLQLAAITWGNSDQAFKEVGGSRYFALTPHHVIVLQLNFASDNLDLRTAMEPRLGTWRFAY